MKALLYTNPQEMVFTDQPDPEAGADDRLIDIHSVGICGSDMHAYLGHDDRRPPPLILGHEAAGVVSGGAEDGRRVVINPLVTCGVCGDCTAGRANLCASREIISMPPRHGAFAQKVAVPARNLVTVPDRLDLATAALAEPLATSWHAAKMAERLSLRSMVDSRALVIGGGAVGLGAALVLRALGCAEIAVTETNAGRRQTVNAAGFKQVIDPAAGESLDPGSADVVIDAVGAKPTRRAAVAACRPGGVIVHVGLLDGEDGLDARRLTLQEIILAGTYTYTMDDFEATLAAMAAGRFGALDWYEERPLADGAVAFRDLLDGATGVAKIVLRP